MTLEQLLGVVVAICTMFGAYIGWRKLRKDQKDARVEVLKETNRIITENRDELIGQNTRQQGELDGLRKEVDHLKTALRAVNKLVTAEASIAELRGTMLGEFTEVKQLLRAGKS